MAKKLRKLNEDTTLGEYLEYLHSQGIPAPVWTLGDINNYKKYNKENHE